MNTRQLHRLVDRICDDLEQMNITELRTTLHNELNIARDHPAAHDGYPTRTPGASPSSSTSPARHTCDTHSSDDCDACNPIDLTTVEAAVAAHTTVVAGVIVTATRTGDDHQRALRAVLRSLTALDDTRVNLTHRLTQFAALRAGTTPAQPPAGCWALARIGHWEAVDRTRVIDGDTRHLSRWAADFYDRTNRLPTVSECRAHAEGRKVYVKA